MKKAFIIILAFSLMFLLVGCNKDNSQIYDSKGELITEFKKASTRENDINNAYIDIVFKETLEILMKEKNLEKEQAEKEIYNDYKIYTFCDTEIISNINKAYKNINKDVDFGSAVTDLDGKLIAVYSSPSDTNFSAQKNPPYSTIKPLAVYCQALESNQINWSSMIDDSPFKKIKDENGITRDWPSNATNTYLSEPVTIHYALKESLNTVAVKVLNDYGVKNSIDFLMQNFGINLKTEAYKANIFGGEEVVGNIALGYTIGGESTIDMAGYYQIFANGGNYTPPSAIKKITDKTGKVIYENKSVSKRIISEETSYIMNELLQGVVSVGGTGEKAFCTEVAVAGKTGTGDDNSGNWFVGVTPEYSCAVWHSNCKNNYAAEIFSNIIKSTDINIKDFRTSSNVVKKIYCKESGKLFSAKCTQVEMGYYTADNIPTICDKH